MKRFILVLCLVTPFYGSAIQASDAEDRAALVEMVQAFFDAMTARDTERMRAMLTEDGYLYGYRDGADGLSVINPSHRQYVDGLQDGERRLVERFWDPQVLLHDRMAVVWTPYDLYVDGDFSHCGIDNFNFLKLDDGWKITGIVFSMETGDCPASPLGPLQD